MPQHDLDIAGGGGLAVRADINNALIALGTTMRGPNPPPAPQAGMMWLDDNTPSSTVWTLFLFDGTDWVTMGTLDTVGNQFSPASSSVGMVNLLDNAGFLINQRAYVSGASVGAANTYTLDRWRVVTSGQAVSWTDSAGVRTITAPAGGIETTVEGSRVAADTYVLSWTGTAAATVNGNAVANGAAIALSGGANVVVRFSNGTVALPQLQRGRVPTPFEWRHPAVERLLCQRYALPFYYVGGIYTQTNAVEFLIPTPVRMRVTPTATNTATAAGSGQVSVTNGTSNFQAAIVAGTLTISAVTEHGVVGSLAYGGAVAGWFGSIAISGFLSAEF